MEHLSTILTVLSAVIPDWVLCWNRGVDITLLPRSCGSTGARYSVGATVNGFLPVTDYSLLRC